MSTCISWYDSVHRSKAVLKVFCSYAIISRKHHLCVTCVVENRKAYVMLVLATELRVHSVQCRCDVYAYDACH